MSKFGKELIQAAKEARAIARGEADRATFQVHAPPIIDVRAIRRRQGLSQNEFAALYNISPGTLRDWEQHRSQPEGPARTLLRIIDKDPKAAVRALRRKA